MDASTEEGRIEALPFVGLLGSIILQSGYLGKKRLLLKQLRHLYQEPG